MLVWVFRPAIEFGGVGMGAINTINSVITVITDIRFVGDIAIDVVLVNNGITIINIINLTGGLDWVSGLGRHK
ncbi:hypothetical protein BSPWISOXPB_4619 [uncultured Gammaproteobacteria bacterium]|nr:hypothetical protein BSPWISOXPB_4619 [uncultured Gammaproteobacteria bacterium]